MFCHVSQFIILTANAGCVWFLIKFMFLRFKKVFILLMFHFLDHRRLQDSQHAVWYWPRPSTHVQMQDSSGTRREWWKAEREEREAAV
jgi:hypothetical protein